MYLCRLSSCSLLTLTSKDGSLTKFRLKRISDYSELANKASKTLIMIFFTIYSYEQAFSSILFESKYKYGCPSIKLTMIWFLKNGFEKFQNFKNFEIIHHIL